MFPSMRISLSGLDNDQNYCVLLEMVPIADCRFKFSGSQWVPAGGAEPQSLQNIYIHPDSPALGSHWQAQPINFNKVKLTNNTLDSSGHVSIITRLSGFNLIPLLAIFLQVLTRSVFLKYSFSQEQQTDSERQRITMSHEECKYLRRKMV
jgi:hypothetical protein